MLIIMNITVSQNIHVSCTFSLGQDNSVYDGKELIWAIYSYLRMCVVWMCVHAPFMIRSNLAMVMHPQVWSDQIEAFKEVTFLPYIGYQHHLTKAWTRPVMGEQPARNTESEQSASVVIKYIRHTNHRGKTLKPSSPKIARPEQSASVVIMYV